MKTLLVDTPVTTIGNYAFKSNDLTSVVIPDSVTTIGSSAFKGNELTIVVIEGDATRFNDRWTDIGFPDELKAQ